MKLLNSQNLLIASLLGFSTLVTLMSSCNHYSPIYTNLVNLLQSEEWKEADVETYRVMLVVTKRQIEGWMRPEDVENIPCQDLHCILTIIGQNTVEASLVSLSSNGYTKAWMEPKRMMKTFGDHSQTE